MKNFVIFLVVAILMAGCACPLKKHCGESVKVADQSQVNVNAAEQQLRKTYKLENRKISIITDPPGAKIYHRFPNGTSKYLGISPLQNVSVIVLAGVNDGAVWDGNVQNTISRYYGSAELMILKEGYRLHQEIFPTDPNTTMSYSLKLTRIDN